MWRRTRSVGCGRARTARRRCGLSVWSSRWIGVGLGGLRGGRDADARRRAHARWKRGHLAARTCSTWRSVRIARQAIRGVDLLVEDRPHLAVVPDVRLAVAGVGRRRASRRSGLPSSRRLARCAAGRGPRRTGRTTRSRRLDDHVRAVVERQPVHAVGRHHALTARRRRRSRAGRRSRATPLRERVAVLVVVACHHGLSSCSQPPVSGPAGQPTLRARTPIGAIRRKPAAWRSSSLSPPQNPYSWFCAGELAARAGDRTAGAHRRASGLAALSRLRALRGRREEQVASGPCRRPSRIHSSSISMRVGRDLDHSHGKPPHLALS